jgi:peptidoglycan/LPS O-acetylase OafA/YrhL
LVKARDGSPVRRIKEFEGLRGCLAWWVVIFHIYQWAGVERGAVPMIIERAALFGWVSVDLFIILSGFVITLLIETQREGFGVFIVRRFFRLAPVYYVVIAYGAVDAWARGGLGGRLREHILVHLTILHGLVPGEILEGSANALCHPAWSISVEWQFYLVAPLVLALIRGAPARALGLLLACMALTVVLMRHFTWPFQATVVMRAGLFGVGIASYYFYRFAMAHAEAARPLVTYLLPAGAAAVWVANTDPFTPIPPWLVIYATVMAYHLGVETAVTRPIRRALGLPTVVWLGQISYCTYLCHSIVLSEVPALLGDRFTRMDAYGRLLALAGLGIPTTLGLSAALHYAVEKPGMRIGKEVSSWFERPATAPAIVEAKEPVAISEANASL